MVSCGAAQDRSGSGPQQRRQDTVQRSDKRGDVRTIIRSRQSDGCTPLAMKSATVGAQPGSRRLQSPASVVRCYEAQFGLLANQKSGAHHIPDLHEEAAVVGPETNDSRRLDLGI